MRHYRLYIEDIQERARRIIKYCEDQTYELFLNDEMTMDAVVYNLEIIGEAMTQIPQSIKDKNPDIPWQTMIIMRDTLAYEYREMNPQIIWESVRGLIPDLLIKMEQIVL